MGGSPDFQAHRGLDSKAHGRGGPEVDGRDAREALARDDHPVASAGGPVTRADAAHGRRLHHRRHRPGDNWARHGPARHGPARHGPARQRTAGYKRGAAGGARSKTVRPGVASHPGGHAPAFPTRRTVADGGGRNRKTEACHRRARCPGRDRAAGPIGAVDQLRDNDGGQHGDGGRHSGTGHNALPAPGAPGVARTPEAALEPVTDFGRQGPGGRVRGDVHQGPFQPGPQHRRQGPRPVRPGEQLLGTAPVAILRHLVLPAPGVARRALAGARTGPGHGCV